MALGVSPSFFDGVARFQVGCAAASSSSHQSSATSVTIIFAVFSRPRDRGPRVIHPFIFHNESLFPIEKVRLSPGQAGLICGWGIFTTVRISRGEAFAYERHWRRLEKDAGMIHLPMVYTGAKIRVHLHEVIRANKV